MFGVGLGEVLIIFIIAVLVFGGPVAIAFFIGYQAGQKKGSQAVAPSTDTPSAEEAPDE